MNDQSRLLLIGSSVEGDVVWKSRGKQKRESATLYLTNGEVEGSQRTELEGVGVLVGRDDTEPLAHLVLLEEGLGQVLEVALGEVDLGGDGKGAGGLAGDLDILAELSSLALDLDVVNEELLVPAKHTELVSAPLGCCVEEESVRSGVELVGSKGSARGSFEAARDWQRRTILSLAGPVKSMTNFWGAAALAPLGAAFLV